MISERILGRLEEFKAWAMNEFADIRRNQIEILNKLDRINQDRWIMYGKMTIINGILVMAIEIFTRRLVN